MSNNAIELIRIWLPITISFLGLGLSVVSLCFTIWVNISHRGKLNIYMFWAYGYNNDGRIRDMEGISMTITNTGKENVSISHFAGYKKSGSGLIMPPDGIKLPYKLLPKENVHLFWQYSEGMKEWTKLNEFVVFDTLIRKFKANKKEFLAIKEKIKEK
jgi:hypothetical protein